MPMTAVWLRTCQRMSARCPGMCVGHVDECPMPVFLSTNERPLTPLCEADANGTAASSGKDDGGSIDIDQKDVFFVDTPGASDADKIAAAAERQRDSAALAAWYAGRARELDARAGQLRHAATLCRFGARRVVVSSSGGPGGDVTEGHLVRLDRLLQHLTSLVRRELERVCTRSRACRGR